ncbi:hypothetical protein CCHR01_18284, partial [Colletotrichum chrysophilum]
ASAPATPAQIPDMAADVPAGATPPVQTPPVGRQAAYAETRRWLEIVRQIREMPDPQGSILWCSVIYVFVQAAKAVATCDTKTEAVVLDGLRKNGAAKIAQRQTEAQLKKGYRELFQGYMRPTLLGRGAGCGMSVVKRKPDSEFNAAQDCLRRGFAGARAHIDSAVFFFYSMSQERT